MVFCFTNPAAFLRKTEKHGFGAYEKHLISQAQFRTLKPLIFAASKAVFCLCYSLHLFAHTAVRFRILCAAFAAWLMYAGAVDGGGAESSKLCPAKYADFFVGHRILLSVSLFVVEVC